MDNNNTKQLSLELPAMPESQTFADAHDAQLTVEVIPGELAKVAALLDAVGNFADDARLHGVLRDIQYAQEDLRSLLHRIAQIDRTLRLRAASEVSDAA